MISKHFHHVVGGTLFFLAGFSGHAIGQTQTLVFTGVSAGNTNAPPGNIRQIIEPSQLLWDTNIVRVELQAPPTAEMVVTGAYVGQQASPSCPYCMNPATVQPLTFNTKAVTTVPAGTSVWSDWQVLTCGPTGAYVVSVGYSGGENLTWGGNGTSYQLYGAENIAGAALVPAYTKTSAGVSLIVQAVEVDTVTSQWMPKAVTRPLHLLEPPNGTVIHGAGQDPVSFASYTNAMGGAPPALFMSYIDLQDDIAYDFSQLTTALGAYSNLLIPEIGLSMMNLATNTPYDAAVANGQYASEISALCQGLKALNRPVFLRIGFEFNGQWNGYTPSTYIPAFQHIVNAIRAAGLNNVAVVWDFSPEGANQNYMSFYPGAGYVDWWALDLFLPSDLLSLNSLAFMQEANIQGFPIMIGESTPEGVGVAGGSASWTTWFAPYFRLMAATPWVKAFCYVDWNWAMYPQWAAWGDARVETNATVLADWQAELGNPKFIDAAPRAQILSILGVGSSQ